MSLRTEARKGAMSVHRAPAVCLSMILPENRFTLFRIMLEAPAVSGNCRRPAIEGGDSAIERP